MTVKELSDFTGKTERAVRNWVKKASEKSSVIKEKSSVSSSTYPANYSIDEVEHILSCSNLGVNATCIVMANARENQKKPELLGIDYQEMAEAMASVIIPIVEKIIDSKLPIKQKEPLLLTPVKTDRNELRELVNKYARIKLHNDFQEAWHVLYKEIYYRMGMNISLRAENRNMTKLEYLEAENMIDSAMLIMKDLLGSI